MGILIFILIIAIIIYGSIFYLVDLFLNRLFKPNEEYLLEINNFKYKTIKEILEPIVIFMLIVAKSKTIKISGLFIFIIFELIYFLSKLKYLKSKEESINTIKYFILKTAFEVLALMLTVLYFYFTIMT